MKVYLEPQTNSRGILRVRDALVRYLPPTVELVDSIENCDLAILHIYGRHTTMMHKIGWLKSKGKKYAMIQYCIRSTMRPDTKSWLQMWDGAEVVWSYYDIPELMAEDVSGGKPVIKAGIELARAVSNFYHAPLGVDAEVFQDEQFKSRPYLIAATSQHALSESVRECAFATKEVGGEMVFFGHELRRGSDIICKSGLPDSEMAVEYSKSQYVSGLRRTEGFELPVIEGAICGCTPIVFSKSHYWQWFKEFAIFIPEGSRDEVIKSLVEVFKSERKPITNEQKYLIRERFNWETIIKDFWSRIL